MTTVGIGFSQDVNTLHAARDAALQAKTQAKQKTVDLVMVFATNHYNPDETMRVIRQTMGDTKIIGCSTAGVILSESIEMRGIAVLVISSFDFKFGIGFVNNLRSIDMRIAGTELAKTTTHDFGQNRRGIFIIFSDGSLKSYSMMVKGVQEILGRIFPVIGASSSDNFLFKETYQFFQDKALHYAASALLIGGQAQVALGTRHGWKPLGKPRFVTKAEGNVIKTIDNKRASGLYEEYFGLTLEDLRSQEISQAIILYPLGVYMEGEKEYLLRTPISVLSDGSLICQGDIPENSEIHLMISNKDFLKQSTFEAAREAKEAIAGKEPKIVLIFESLSRHRLLRRESIQEVQIVKEVLGATVPVFGMYSFNEIAPLKSLNQLGEAYLQNGTIIVLVIA